MRLATSLSVVLILSALAGCGAPSVAPLAADRSAASTDARFLDWIHPRIGRSYAKDALVLEAKSSWFHGFKSSSFTIQAPAVEHMTDTTGKDDEKKLVEMVTTAFLGKDGGVYFQPFTLQTGGNETRMIYEERYYRLASYESKRGPEMPMGGVLKVKWIDGVKLVVKGMPFKHKSYMLKLDKPPVPADTAPELWPAPPVDKPKAAG